MNDIIKHRIFVANQIQKSIANIGEIRHWQDGDYKKIDSGKWVRVGDAKMKKIGDAKMKKVISDEFQSLQDEFERIKTDFEEKLDTKYLKGTLQYKVFFANAWSSENKKNEFLKKIREKQKDLQGELLEIEKQIHETKKRKREELVGKSEIDYDDLNSMSNDIYQSFANLEKSIKKYGNAAEVMPDVTTDTYFLDTETEFENIIKQKGRKDLDDVWNKMKNESGFSFHKSPKSDSEYLIDEKTGDVYRYANHWFRVASCYWELDEPMGYYGYDIAKSNIKNFKRRKSGAYFNPAYREAVVDLSEKFLSKINDVVSNDKTYLTDKAAKRVKRISEKIYNTYLRESARLSIEEVDKIRKKFESV